MGTDSRGVIVRERLDAEGNQWELRLIPIGGGQPRKLDLDTRNMLSPVLSAISVHPDGRQIAYVAGGQKEEVWVLENFLPAAAAAK